LAIVVVGGSGKDIGKTAFVCAMVSALSEYRWTAVKVTGHDYQHAEDKDRPTISVIHEETEPGEDTDTARYLAAGARRALLVTRTGSGIPIHEILRTIGRDQNVIFESNRIIDAINPDICLALVGGDERKPSFQRLLELADAMIMISPFEAEPVEDGIRQFKLDSVDCLSEELLSWLRRRLLLHVH